MGPCASARRPLIFAVFLLIGTGVTGMCREVQAAPPSAYAGTGIQLPFVPHSALGNVGKSCGSRQAPLVFLPRYSTYPTFQTVVPTTTMVMVPPSSTRIVAIPSAAPANPRLISTALPEWYLAAQAIRQIPSTGTSGATFVGGTGRFVTVAY